MNLSCLIGRLELLHVVDEYRKCVYSLKEYLSVIKTDKHVTDEFKIIRIKFFVESYIELTNDFSLSMKMIKFKVSKQIKIKNFLSPLD